MGHPCVPAKSVISWHMIASTTVYSQLAVAALWSTELEKHLNSTSNITCASIPSVSVFPAVPIAGMEFQVIRTLFELFPYDILALEPDKFAYPLVASVPIITGILQMIVYLEGGGLCQKLHLSLLARKLNINIVMENFIFPKLILMGILSFMFVGLEIFIRVWKNWSSVTRQQELKCHLNSFKE